MRVLLVLRAGRKQVLVAGETTAHTKIPSLKSSGRIPTIFHKVLDLDKIKEEPDRHNRFHQFYFVRDKLL